jgi:hypothetical protein
VNPISFYPDTAIRSSEDCLDFRRFVDPLTSVLASPDTNTPFTVGIFGPWGSGKSTFLTLLQESLEAKHPDAFMTITFNPWIYRREPNMLVPLLHAVHDATQTKLSKVSDSAKKIFDVLARLGADLLLKTVTVNAVDLDRLDKLEKQYVESHRAIESEMRKLRQTLEEWAKEIHGPKKDGKRIVFAIDDLDRCEPNEIIDVLEAIKLFLDVPHVIVVLAVDKEVIDRGIEVRYSKFDFAAGRQAALGAEYLEKMVQLPVTLPPLGKPEVTQLFAALKVAEILPEQVGLLARLVPPNPRKIKRILNMIALTKAVIAETRNLPALDMNLIARLVVMQVQDGELYGEIARRPDFLDAIQTYYVDKANKSETNFNRFDANKELFETLCKKFFKPGTYLSLLFEDSPFNQILKDQVLLYLNLTLTKPQSDGNTHNQVRGTEEPLLR